jgi:sortase A
MTASPETLEQTEEPAVVVIRDRPWLRNPFPQLINREPRPPVREPLAVTVAVRGLLGFSLLAVWVLLYAFALSGIQEGRNQGVLYAQLRQQLSGATTPFGGVIQPGYPVMLLDARSAGLRNVVVVEGTTSSDLASGPGHLASTPMPGQAGVSVLLGRSVTFGAPFRSIGSMRTGDLVQVTTGQGEFSYRVDGVRHKGDPLPVPLAAGKSRLTLVSSVAAGWRGGWAPQQTVYVDASLVTGTVQPAPSGRPNVVPLAAQPMQSDSSSLVSLVLWLQGLLVVVVLAAFGRSRWGRWQTWLLAMPLTLACLWGATQAAVVLLPNLV